VPHHDPVDVHRDPGHVAEQRGGAGAELCALFPGSHGPWLEHLIAAAGFDAANKDQMAGRALAGEDDDACVIGDLPE
jgi:hypothetical protein